jgi:CHAD domain-containing protein
MVSTHREDERKYTVEPSFALPDLAQLDGVAAVGEPRQAVLEATYFDTPRHGLLRHCVTLRRRTGGDDAGWHLKLPAPDGSRTEVRRSLGRSSRTVPAALARLVPATARGERLAPVARLTTRRTIHHLLGPDGAVLAEVSDDEVKAEALGDAVTVQAWREVEVELIGAGLELAGAVHARLTDAGAAPSATASKLDRLLNPDPQPAGAEEPKLTAGSVVLRHLHEQVGELILWDPYVRLDGDDSIHRMRVATRRLRSALSTFRPVLDRSVTDPVRTELKWLAGLLGVPRDAEVMREHLTGLLQAERADLVLGPVARRVRVELSGRYSAGREGLLAELDGERYFRLLDTLEQLLAAPPLTDEAARPATKVLPARARRSWRRLERAAAAALESSGEARDHALHETRKAAKRARYAGEALAPALGRAPAKFAEAMEDLQEVLGQHQDSVVSRMALHGLAVRAHLSGENGFTFGRLHAMEQARADEAERSFADAWKQASRRSLRRWLR